MRSVRMNRERKHGKLILNAARRKKKTRLKRKRKNEKYFIKTFQCMIAVTLKIICEKSIPESDIHITFYI